MFLIMFFEILIFVIILVCSILLLSKLWVWIAGSKKRKELTRLNERKEKLSSLTEGNEIAEEEVAVVKDTIKAEKKLTDLETKIKHMEKEQ